MAPRLCRTCSRPLTLALPPGKDHRVLRCIYCDDPDPIKSLRVERWFKGLLRDEAPAKTAAKKSNLD
jgi:hypothetical protein